MIKKQALDKSYLLLAFLLIITSSYANYFSRDWSQGPLICFVYAGILVILKRSIVFTKQMGLVYFILFSYFTITFVTTGSINITYALGIFLRITAIFWALRLMQFDFFILIERIISFLALFSIILYPIQLLIFDTLYGFIKPINDILPWFFYEADNTASVILFVLKKEAILRNSGFMWEPGAFAAFLLISMMLNLIIYNFKINRSFIIQFIALLTTLSTMGYLGLPILLYLYYLNNPGKIKLMVVVLLVPATMLTFMTFDFIITEVISEFNNVQNVIDYAYTAKNYTYTSLGRMGSFIMDMYDLKRYPILGIAGNIDLMSQPFSEDMYVNRTCGLSAYILTFGILGLFLLLYNLRRTSKLLKGINYFKGDYLFVVLIIFVSFSNTILETIIFWGFQFFYLAYLRPHFLKSD